MSIDVDKRRQEELRTVREIIKIYCHGHKHLREAECELCPECQKMADYALGKLEKCPRMDIKTFCSVCPIHCYGKEEAAKIREIMAFGGPRMLWYHPWMTLRHIFIEWRTRHGWRKKEAVVRHK
ncbi:Nitrous oxide-stimulated promoter [Selenomonas ruminantium]|uniref:Nitrous oxide-stimulated promoter n=1 Tax=Selenomonas ruminantium TaxID=971 RepID=A0A1M6TMX6_SELRU|nr:Nitrous oxide-stimulated promoter [Selenomonas ruminantium]